MARAAEGLYSTVDPAAGLTADDVAALREWVREMDALPTPAPVVPRRCRDCGDRARSSRSS
ncbi:hypothetical protein [Streptomyces californicus]|uniref:hypothetical protein n=1 Tax=Streptomyces californicus TaxID=67351 RepID=UPI001EF77578|nr:hypothetical protein [Streptomyces californicus]